MSDIDWPKFRARDWLGAAATVFALAVTFNAEYEIAIAVHIHPLVAYAVPGALDVYVLRALQVKRDVFLTVLAMVAVNAASHLVTAGVLRVSPALIVAVSAIAPLVLWRAHVLRHAATAPSTPRWWHRAQKHTEERPVLVNAVRAWGEHEIDCTCLVCLSGTNPAPRAPEHTPDAATWTSTLDEHADQAISVTSTGAVNVPEQQYETCSWCDWKWCPSDLMEQHKTNACVKRFEHETSTDNFDQIGAAWFGQDPEHVPGWDGTVVDETSTERHAVSGDGARVLSLVPPLPAGFDPVLADGDKEFLDRARVLDKLSIRALKDLGMGNERARRIKQYLESEHKEARS